MLSSATPSTISISSRACQNCSRAKAKCIPQPEYPGDQCARCLRLKKDCIVLPRSTRKRRSPNTAKSTAQLEQKIESLVSLLSANPQLTLPSSPSLDKQDVVVSQPLVERPNNGRPSFLWVVEPPVHKKDPWNTQLPFHNDGQPSVSSTSYSAPHPASTIESISAPPNIVVKVDNPDHLIKMYREFYEPHFPFVPIPLSISSQELKAKRPWLHRTIMMVASHENRSQQMEISKEITMDLAAALLVRSEKSLDMLESMIIFNAWSYYYAPLNPQVQSTAVLQLALGLLFDLGLNKPVREADGPEILSDSLKPCVAYTREKNRSTEERRAFLSCFVLVSSASCCIKKSDTLDHSPYIEHSCQALIEAAEYESDLILVFLVRSQCLIERINREFPSNGLRSDSAKAPLFMHVKSAGAELQDFLSALPSHLRQHTLVLISYYSCEIFIRECSLQRLLFPSNLNSERLDMMYACLISCKSLLDVYLALPLSSFYGISLMGLPQIGLACSTAFKLSFIDDPGWDLAHVRNTVNLLSYFEEISARFEQVGEQIDAVQQTPCKISFCTGCSKAIRRVKGWYDGRLALETEEKRRKEQTELTGMEDILSGERFGYLDDTYFMGDWQEIMGDLMQQ